MQIATARPALRHIYGLDLLRCAAAVLVAGFHFTRKLDGAEQIVPFGWVGVEVFFLISGCVIAYSAQHADPMRFVRSRFLRLYPTAWFVAVLSGMILAVVPAYHWRAIQVSVFTDPGSVINSFSLTGIGMSGSYWTLPVELAFYLCVFLLLLAGQVHWLRKLALALTVYSTPYIVLLSLHHLRVVHMPFLEFDLSLWNALLLRHGLFFAVGLYLFAASQAHLSILERCAVGVAVLLGLLEIACRAAEQMHGAAISSLVSLPWLIVEAETIFVLALAATAAALRWNGAFPYRMRALSRALGLATYPFYLAHEILGGLTIMSLLRIGAGPIASVVGAMAVVLAVAYVVSSRIDPVIRGAFGRVAAARKPGAASLGAA